MTTLTEASPKPVTIELTGIESPSWDTPGGYQDDYSRSNRSARAIEAFEVPISMVKRALIDRFLTHTDASEGVRSYLTGLPVAIWTWAAKQHVHPASWHHTSGWYNATDHYSLVEVANFLIEERELVEEHRAGTRAKHTDVKRVQPGVIMVAVFDGHGRNARFAGHKTHVGVLDGSWFFYQDSAGATRKFKADAGRVENLDTYRSVRALVAAHPEYKGAGKALRALARERGATL